MRKLMWTALGFTAACALCAYALPLELAGCLFPAAAAVSLVLFLCGRKSGLVCRAALILLGLGLGFGWYGLYDGLYLSPAASLDGKTQPLAIRTTDFSYDTAYGVAVDGRTRLEGKPYQIRVYLNRQEPVEPGWEITGSFRLRMTSEGEMTYHASKGIFLLAYQQGDAAVVPGEESSWLEKTACFRQALRHRIKGSFPGDTASFAMALLLGDTSAIDYETDTALKVSGIRHVIAVSGLHVSILMALLSAATFRKKFLMVPVGLGGMLLFAALAGFSPSVVRSCMMSALMLLAVLFDREYDGATALSFAVLTMLICNPLAVTSVSLQLSAASVAGIFLFEGRLRTWLLSLSGDSPGRFVRAVCLSVSVTFSAMTLTTPLCAYYFGMVSLISPVTNLLTLWAISGIFYGIMAVCLLSVFQAGAAGILAGLVSWPIRCVLKLAGFLAELPLSAVYTESVYIVFWLIFVYLLLAVFLFSPGRKPSQLICCAVLGLCISLLPSWISGEETRLTVLDVGQGQCILLESGGKTYMVDCGGDRDEACADLASAHLLSRGISRLDGLILTHLDRDHAGAVPNLLSRVDTDLLILPPEYTDLSQEFSGETVYASEDLLLTAGDVTLGIFAPTFGGTANEKSLCVLFDTEKCDILITGDRDGFGERMLLRNAEIPDVDILIAGHHGSKHSTCEELLTQVSPEIVCISAGQDNPFGHPAPELLQRLEAFGCTVYRTDTQGTITIRR